MVTQPTSPTQRMFSNLLVDGMLVALKSMEALKIDKHEKGFAVPFGLEQIKAALSVDGAGHMLTTVNCCTVDFSNTDHRPDVRWHSIAQSSKPFYIEGPTNVTIEAALPCWLPGCIGWYF